MAIYMVKHIIQGGEINQISDGAIKASKGNNDHHIPLDSSFSLRHQKKKYSTKDVLEWFMVSTDAKFDAVHLL